MRKIPDIIPITDLRQDAATALRRVRESKEPVVITLRGRAAAVIRKDNPTAAVRFRKKAECILRSPCIFSLGQAVRSP